MDARLLKTAADAGTRLEDQRRRIEASFLALGGRLSDGAGVVSDLSDMLGQTVEHLRSADLDAEVTRLRTVAGRASAMAARFADEQAAMRALGGAVDGARRPLADLDRTIRTIGITATTARVTSAPLESRGTDVGFFSTDLEVLSAQARETLRAFAETYARLGQDIRQATSTHARFEAEYRQRLAELPSLLDQRLADATAHCRASEAAAEEVRRTSEGVGARIAGAVSALQAGDSARQRVEHCESALVLLAALDGPDPQDRAATLALGLALTAAQLEGTTEDLSAEAEAGRRQMDALAQDAAAIVEGGRRLLARPSAADHPFQALRRTLKTATGLLADCENERAELDLLARTVSEAIEKLFAQLRSVERIEADMQLLAINAAIRCSRLGADGRALTVISDQLTELTGETRRAVRETAVELRQAVAPAEAISAAGSEDGAAAMARLEAEVQRSLASLDALDGRLQAAEGGLERQAPRAVGLLSDAAQAFESLEEILKRLRDVGAGLRDAAPAPRTSPAPADATLFAALRATYTMEEERRIHDSFLSGGRAAECGRSASGQAPVEEDWEAFG